MLRRHDASAPSETEASEMVFGVETSQLVLVEDGRLAGFAFDPLDLDRRFTIEILLDGMVAMTAYADNFVPELAEQRIGDGTYGFTVNIPATKIAAASRVEARIANAVTAVGLPIDLTSPSEATDPRPWARLRWQGGLRFSGWIDTAADTLLETLIDGDVVSQIHASLWTRIDDRANAGGGRNVRAFDFHLPERFADGRVHHITLRKTTGEPVPAATIFIAFPDGLAQFLEKAGNLPSEHLRGDLFDQIIPSSLPFADYPSWRERFPLPAPVESEIRIAVVIIGQHEAERTIDSLEAQTHPHWSAGITETAAPTLDPNALEELLDDVAADAECIAVVASGAILAPDALARIAAAFDSHPEAIALYGDLDLLAGDGRLWPLAFPAFDYERMLEQGYCAHLFALRIDAARVALVVHPENIYRLFNASFDVAGPISAPVLHLPGALATIERIDANRGAAHLATATRQHLETRGVPAKVTVHNGHLFPTVQVQRLARLPRTTILIPTRDRLSLLKTCLDSIAPAVARIGAEILVIDNDSVEPETLAFLNDLPRQGIRTIRVEGPFNFARLNNKAAAAVDSEALCLLNNDIEAIDDVWLEEMLSRLAEPDVGAVGALLTWPGGVVQHAGVVLGSNFAATHAFTDRMADDPGYTDLLRAAHECSVVTAACLLTRREDYLAVGGMDDIHFAVAFNDVDYCLRLREAGKRVVFTPYARLIHAESASRGSDDRADRRNRFGRELNSLRARWGQHLIDDPSYNPQLSRNAPPYGGLAWPPGTRVPRFNDLPRAIDIPPGF